jgi:histidinol-phosphate/aromatic aminotransferase/cobyric acid decarboxylase-like protein
MQAAAADLARYPDANGFALKEAISARLSVPMDWITLGNGSNDILELAAHALVQPGQSVVYAQYSFAVYALATQAVGGRAIVVPARDHGHDLDAMLAAIGSDTRLVFVANPNNPTGTFLAPAAVEAFLARVPPTWWWSTTRPTPSTCRPTSATTRSPGCGATRTSSCRAPSRRPTGWPGCAWATASRRPSSPT